MENRNLAQAPSFSIKKFASGQFGDEMEDYLSDQIIGKDVLVTAKNDTEWFLGKRKLGEVYIKSDGTYMTGYEEDKKQVEKNINEVNLWAEKVPAEVPVTCFLVPNAIDIKKTFLPAVPAEDSQEDTIKTIKESLSKRISFVDVEGALKEHADEKLYFFTDHHWTMKGAYYGFEALARQMGLKPLPLSQYHTRILAEDFQGSLYSKAPVSFAAREEIEYFYNPAGQYDIRLMKEEKSLEGFLVEEKLGEKDKYAAFFGGNYGEMRIQSNARSQQKILVLKDSYANIMLPFLADAVSDLYVLDLRYYTGDVAEYIKENEISQVVLCYNVDFWNTDNHFIRLN